MVFRQVRDSVRNQAISHRGYKAASPENTMAAFRGAADVGADAIETDLCICRKTASSCCRMTLRTLREPKGPIPRLVDLLAYLNEPGREHLWLFLDIKTDDDSTRMLSCLAAAIASISPTRPWNQRIILGSWDANWLRACLRFLPEFPVAITAFSPEFAAARLSVPQSELQPVQHLLLHAKRVAVPHAG
ncbi:PLC-like phosphodiesterase [Hypoxylon sp. FL1150]|nr:PLC-like phosphodiesterase [Hypoxylon sp. FL1150]